MSTVHDSGYNHIVIKNIYNILLKVININNFSEKNTANMNSPRQ